MPNVFLRSKATRIAPDDLRDRLVTVLTEALPEAGVVGHVGTGPQVVLSWRDGPAAATVADLVAGVVNWEVRIAASAPPADGAPAVILARAFSDRALAVAVVRYQASNVRPYDSTRERAVAGLRALLEIDHPDRSGYPVPDAMADLLLAAPDPPDLEERAGPDPSPADRLAAKLAAVGYDRLWHRAWSGVT